MEALLAKRGLPGRRVLIVGGAGYVGSVLAGHLLDRGYHVRCLDLLIYGHSVAVLPFLGNSRYEFQWGDMGEDVVLDRALQEVTDVVILAGLVGDPITKKYPEASSAINDNGTAKLIKHCNGQGLERVIFVSTCSNYGLVPADAIADETFDLSPLSLYARSKVAAEKILLSGRGAVDYSATVLRFATAFGLSARMRFDLTVSEFTRAMFCSDELVVFDADTWRPYCHVQDFAELIRRVLEAPATRIDFEVFNAGGDVNNLTKQMIVDTIRREFPEAAPVRYRAGGSDPRNYRVTFTKVRKQLMFLPLYTVQDGVRELLRGLREHLFENVDSNSNFYGNYEISWGDPGSSPKLVEMRVLAD